LKKMLTIQTNNWGSIKKPQQIITIRWVLPFLSQKELE
jgi:hypothetical protein